MSTRVVKKITRVVYYWSSTRVLVATLQMRLLQLLTASYLTPLPTRSNIYLYAHSIIGMNDNLFHLPSTWLPALKNREKLLRKTRAEMA